MKTINYSSEWDKVKPENRVVGRKFTTVRGYTPQKETYYIESIGMMFHQMVKEIDVGTARLLSVRTTRPSTLGEAFMRRDTYRHYTMRDVRADMKRFYRNEDPIVLLLDLEWTSIQENII